MTIAFFRHGKSRFRLSVQRPTPELVRDILQGESRELNSTLDTTDSVR
jgi:hypothetical protein